MRVRGFLCCLLLLLLLLPCLIFAGDGVWTGHGPFMAEFDFLEPSPAQPNIVYAGNQTALVKSTDFGLTWKTLSRPDSMFCPAMVRPHPRNADIAYAVVSCQTVVRTRDGGRTWQTLNTPSLKGTIGDLVINPRNPLVLYLAEAGGEFMFSWPANLFKSTDAGATWTKILSCPACTDGFTAEMRLDPGRPNRLYVLFDKWFFHSTNFGRTWTKLRIGQGPMAHLAVDPTNGNKLYVVAPGKEGVFRSVDGGLTWAQTANKCVGDISIDSTAPDTIYTTGNDSVAGCTKKSTDGGQSWSDLVIPGSSPDIVTISHIRVSPRHGNLLYASSDVLYRTLDRGKTWRIITNGKGSEGPDYVRSDGSNIYAIRYNRLYRSLSGSGNWILLNTPSEFTIHDFRSCPANPHLLIAAGVFTIGSGDKQRSLILSSDAGKTWTFKQTPFVGTRQVFAHPADVNRFLVASDSTGDNLYSVTAETTDAGRTWDVRHLPPRCYWVDQGKDMTIFTRSEHRIFKSSDWGKTWTSTSLAPNGVAYLSAGPRYLFVTTHNSNAGSVNLYRSPVDQLKFNQVSELSGLTGGVVPRVWADPSAPDVVFIRDETAPLLSTDAGVTWKTLTNRGLPRYPEIRDLLIMPGSPSILFGAFRNGILSLSGWRVGDGN